MGTQKLQSVKTIEEIMEYSAISSEYQKRRPNSILTIIAQKLSKTLQKALKPHNGRLTDLRTDQASLNAELDIKKDAKGDFEFKKEALKEIQSKVDKWSEDTISFEPIYSKLIPPNLSVFEITAFSGFIIDPERALQLLSKLEENADENIAVKGQPEGKVIKLDNTQEQVNAEDIKEFVAPKSEGTLDVTN